MKRQTEAIVSEVIEFNDKNKKMFDLIVKYLMQFMTEEGRSI